VKVSLSLTEVEKQRAQRTLELTGLDKLSPNIAVSRSVRTGGVGAQPPLSGFIPAPRPKHVDYSYSSLRSDRRQFNRREAWDIAERSLANLKKPNSPEMREREECFNSYTVLSNARSQAEMNPGIAGT
jgi:hypothetical protein